MRRLLTILALALGAVLQSCAPAFAQTSNYGGVSIAGSYTTNCIPVAVTAITLQCAAVTDNGTVVTFTEPLVLPIGTGPAQATSALQFGGNAAFYSNAANSLRLATGGSDRVQLGSAGVFAVSNGAGFGSGTTFGTFDVNLTRINPGIMGVGTGAAQSTAGTLSLASVQYRGLAQTYFVTSDFTTSGVGTALENITGLTWTFPATTAMNVRVDCNILYAQNVANVAVAFGFQDATVAPTNLAASGIQYTSATASTEGTTAGTPGTTATAVTSATPSAITTIWHAQLHFLIEQPSNASTSVFTIMTSTATAADTVTVKRGSYCSLTQ